MGGKNFWGVINHANEEGIFRIADNTKTPGLKFWTFGYDSLNVKPFESPWARRPFIELLAGVTPEFFQKTTLMAGEVYEFEETYSPSVGMTNVNGATEDILVNGFWDEEGQFNLQWHALNPELDVTIRIQQDDILLMNTTFTPDTVNGNAIELEAVNKTISIKITDTTGDILYSVDIFP
jgi:hypothetical protein